MKRYELIEHTADIGIRSYGRNLEELFENMAYGLFNQIAEIATLRPEHQETIKLETTNKEELLIDWLNELLYLFYAKKYLFCRFKVKKITNEQRLEADAEGTSLDKKSVKNSLKLEVKSATYHNLKISKERERYTAEVIFDV